MGAGVGAIALRVGVARVMAAPPMYSIADLGMFTGRSTDGNGVNEWGEVMGWSRTAGGYQRFIWRDGSMTGPGVLSGRTFSCAPGLSNCEEVVGEPGTFGFHWYNGLTVHLPTLGTDWHWVEDISDAGRAAGTFRRSPVDDVRGIARSLAGNIVGATPTGFRA